VPRIAADGFLVHCADDPGAARVGQQARAHGLTAVSAGLAEGALLRGESLRLAGAVSHLEVVSAGRRLGELSLRTTGRHYVLDALCALGAGLELGYPFDTLAGGLGRFSGTRRRMEPKGSAGGVQVYDSYAHHPSEIAGDLAAARALAGGGRVLVCFQPHLVSRTRTFATEMGAALAAADEVVVMDVYVAREAADPAVTGALVADAVPKPAEQVHFEPRWEQTASVVAERSRPGDVVVTLGAGDVTRLGPLILGLLRARSGPTRGQETNSG
jgi:UDP-N-acetylmuramate--alanine ligase